MEINLSCRHFPGDRPCRPHKETGATCGGCEFFEPVGFRVLLIKLDALGDVLRTTCILPSLRRRYPDAHVTWITLAGAEPVLRNNPYIDEILPYDAEAVARLGIEEFDLVLSPDAAKKSASLATYARAKEKRGFGLRSDGRVRPWNEDAVAWLELGARDDKKKANRRTYQEHVHRICGLDPEGQEIVLRLTDAERTAAARVWRAARIESGTPVVGLNTGSSPRWPKKRLPKESYLELIRLLRGGGARVVLLGGPLEAETNRWLAGRSDGFAYDTGSDHPLRDFFAIVGACDVVVTGDTLALHAALALGRRVVALFGPTSSHEVDVYGRGVRLTSDIDCLCCYRIDCDKRPDCMDLLAPARVADAVRAQLDRTLAPAGVGAGAAEPVRD